MREKIKFSRKLVLALGVLYLLAVAGATAFSCKNYRQQLPLVELAVIEDGLVDTKLLSPSDTTGKLALNTVEQQDGPWGKRYIVRQVELNRYVFLSTGQVLMFGAPKLTLPVVRSSTGVLSDGMEVRLE